jgi:hypothetical protein
MHGLQAPCMPEASEAAAVRLCRLLCRAGCEGKTWLTHDLSTGALWAVKMVKLPLHTKMVQVRLCLLFRVAVHD